MNGSVVAEGLRDLHAALDRLAGAGTDACDLRSALSEVARAEARLASVKLRLVAAAEASDAAAGDGSTDTAAWAAKAVGGNRARSWGAVWLARHLEDGFGHTAAALAQGRIGEDHAAVIVRACASVPDGVTAEELARCEEALVAKAERMKPAALRRAARRLLDPVSRRLADVHQEDQLREQERRAERETYLVLGDNGDGTWTGKFTLPDLHAQTLLARLEALSAPRRHTRDRLGRPVADPTVPGMGSHYNRAEALGLAFAELVEHLPVDGHTRSSYSLVVHVSEEQLRAGAGAALLDTGAECRSDRPAGWRVVRGSCRWCCRGRRCRWTSAGSSGCSPAARRSRCPHATSTAPPKAATGRSRGASCTICGPGRRAGAPTSTTPSRCAGSTTAAFTTTTTPPPAHPTGRSGSLTDGPADNDATSSSPSSTVSAAVISAVISAAGDLDRDACPVAAGYTRHVAMRGTVEHPSGLVYREDVLTPSEEESLLGRIAATEFEPVVLRGHAARRTVRHYGYAYDFDSWALSPTERPPAYLDDLRQRCATLAGVAPAAWEEVLVTRYAAGDGIGWHRDAAAFGPVVVGVSLGGEAVMRFQRRAAGGERRVFEQPLARRSAYVLGGAARSAWQHSVPAVPAQRYSVTFRTVRHRT